MLTDVVPLHESDHEHAVALVRYVDEYVSRHPAGFPRAGALCPYAHPALRAGTIHCAFAPDLVDEERFRALLRQGDALFLGTSIGAHRLGLLVIAFPELSRRSLGPLYRAHHSLHAERHAKDLIGALFYEPAEQERAASWPLSFRCPFPMTSVRRRHVADRAGRG